MQEVIVKPEPFEPEVDIEQDEPVKIRIVLLHGILSNSGWWREYQTYPYEGRFASFEIEFLPISYSLTLPYDLIAGVGHRARVEKTRVRLEAVLENTSNDPVSIICHSNGTYVFAGLPAKLTSRFDWVIYSGSICPHDFDEKLRPCKNVINECGLKDPWPVLAAAIRPQRYWHTGVVGFHNAPIRDRFFRFGHAGIKSPAHFHDWILPAVCYNHCRETDPKDRPGTLLTISPKLLRYSFVLLCLVVLAFLGWKQ